jgi:adenylate kinase
MAPLAEQVVDDLKQHIARLEGRIAELEGRLSPGQSKPSNTPEGVRMILIGPPGAGELLWSAEAGFC